MSIAIIAETTIGKVYSLSRRRKWGRNGVSEVLGALLLIVVVVVSVAALASFIATAQVQAENRSAFISNVKNENLQVVSIALVVNQTAQGFWKDAILTIRNTNTAPSQLTQVQVEGFWFPHWNLSSSGGSVTAQEFGVGESPLLLPARGTESIFVNFTRYHQHFARSASLPIQLITTSGNFFTAVFTPPTAVQKVSLSSISEIYFSRDVVSLDGSQSLDSNDSQIVSYQWVVSVPFSNSTNPSGCTLGAFSSPSRYANVTVAGKVDQFFQEAFQNSTLRPLRNFCFAGPFRVSLTVVDALGFVGNTTAAIVPMDANMAPIAQLTASQSGTCGGSNAVVSGRVFSDLGTAVGGAVVLVSHSGIATLNPSYPTSGDGTFSISVASCTAPVSVTISVGGLPAQTFVFNS